MQALLRYPLSVLYYVLFFGTLCVFHPIQWLCLKGFGYDAHKASVSFLNFFIVQNLKILGTRIRFDIEQPLPEGIPLIFVSNHQSTYDIPPMIWHFRKQHPKFISKSSLGKGIPSVSFNLKYGGSVLIDRNKRKQSLEAIETFGKNLEEKKWSAVVFPEGTRSRDGKCKKFHRGGLLSLMKNMPSAQIVPIAIGNSWKFGQQGYFPLPLGVHLKFDVGAPLPIPAEEDHETFIYQLQKNLHQKVEKLQEGML